MNRTTCLLFLGVMASGTIQFANAAASGGIIHITGSIVEAGCNFNTARNKVISDCDHGGKQVRQVHALSVDNPSSFSLPMSLGHVTTKQVNNNPHLAVMTVSYN
ncbi:hypothetical protein [Rahnella victoriana]|uniref:Type 1 fimbrial protein n=1 Tax=Rahnella victoriana TaxID=1510570 RepID=A0ABS0DRI2_9GAMM|nr:hypothetical protein [Rahnella victoriana]MBF7956491.1 hypothetical protein [Rahnella victoriana]TBX36352.1 hypothetical protein EYY67_04985 [Rahnella victoriana]UHM89517.1 hypothetical protein J9880_14460 [Rahnella victoriana]